MHASATTFMSRMAKTATTLYYSRGRTELHVADMTCSIVLQGRVGDCFAANSAAIRIWSWPDTMYEFVLGWPGGGDVSPTTQGW